MVVSSDFRQRQSGFGNGDHLDLLDDLEAKDDHQSTPFSTETTTLEAGARSSNNGRSQGTVHSDQGPSTCDTSGSPTGVCYSPIPHLTPTLDSILSRWWAAADDFRGGGGLVGEGDEGVQQSEMSGDG